MDDKSQDNQRRNTTNEGWNVMRESRHVHTYHPGMAFIETPQKKRKNQPSLSLQIRQNTQQPLVAPSRRKMHSAAIIKQKKTQFTHVSEQFRRVEDEFGTRLHTAMQNLSHKLKSAMNDPLLHDPMLFLSGQSEFQPINKKFRPSFSRKLWRKEKIIKKQPDQLQQLNIFMKTVSEQFSLGKGKLASIPKSPAPSAISTEPIYRKTYMYQKRQKILTFQSLSKIKLKEAKMSSLELAVKGHKF